MPAQIVLDTQVTFVTDPINPCAGTDFVVSWQEINVGDEASGDYTQTINFNDLSNDHNFDVDCYSLEPGESVLREFTINVPDAANYNLNVSLHGYLGNVIIEDCSEA
jgi:hypothetical protein